MVELDMGEKKYLDVSKHFQQINQTLLAGNDANKVSTFFFFKKKLQKYFLNFLQLKFQGNWILHFLSTILYPGRN